MNRTDAMNAGHKTFDTGRPCSKGHYGPRYTSCGVCVECSRLARLNKTRLHNTILASRTADTALFAYKLHPDDHAAALAFCQALDLQRGRLPQAAPVATAATVPPAAEFDAATAREIARRRAELSAPTPTRYLPEEMKPHAQTVA